MSVPFLACSPSAEISSAACMKDFSGESGLSAPIFLCAYPPRSGLAFVISSAALDAALKTVRFMSACSPLISFGWSL